MTRTGSRETPTAHPLPGSAPPPDRHLDAGPNGQGLLRFLPGEGGRGIARPARATEVGGRAVATGSRAGRPRTAGHRRRAAMAIREPRSTVRHPSTGPDTYRERLFGTSPSDHERVFVSSKFRTDVCLRLPGRLSSPGKRVFALRGHPREQATGSSDGYQPSDGQTTDGTGRRQKEHTMAEALSGKRQQILLFIADCLRERGYPPSVREIGEAVGLDLLRHRPHPPGGAPAGGLPAAGPDQAPGHPGPLRPLVEGGHGRRPGPPRPPGRRRGRRHRSAGPGERRGGALTARAVHRDRVRPSCCGCAATR